MKKNTAEYVATGRRKRAIANVRVCTGKGKIQVNKRSFEDYFPLKEQQKHVLSPLQELNLLNQYDIRIRARGGGIQGQMTACRLGIARALVAEDDLRQKELKGSGFLTRDPRKKERKKYGHPKARKSFQFSKR